MHSGRVLSSEMYYVRLALGCKANLCTLTGVSFKKRNPCYQLPVEGGGQRFRTIQMGPRVLMGPVYLVVMDLFAAQTNPSTPPSRRNIEGLAPFTFCCPGHLF